MAIAAADFAHFEHDACVVFDVELSAAEHEQPIVVKRDFVFEVVRVARVRFTGVEQRLPFLFLQIEPVDVHLVLVFGHPVNGVQIFPVHNQRLSVTAFRHIRRRRYFNELDAFLSVGVFCR